MKVNVKELKKNDLFKNIDDKDVEKIIKNSRWQVRTYTKGEIIAQEGDECKSLGLVLSGIINIERMYPSGNSVVMKKLMAGEVYGEALIMSDLTKYPATILAMSNCEVLHITKEEIIRLCYSNINILENFISLLSNKIVVLNNKIKSISFRSIRQKVADYILNEQKRQKTNEIKLASTKEEIATYIGIPRPSFSRELISLRDEGIIEFNRSYIIILEEEKLENILFQ